MMTMTLKQQEAVGENSKIGENETNAKKEKPATEERSETCTSYPAKDEKSLWVTVTTSCAASVRRYTPKCK